MINTGLTHTDFEEIIHFIEKIAGPVRDIRKIILQELSRIFGYNETIFWYVDDNGEITDPAIYRLSEKILYDYLDKHHNHEAMHLKENTQLFREKNVIRIADLMTIDQYEKSLYYRSFMKPHGFYDEMGIALIYEGNFIGLIGMARKKDQNNFTEVDSRRLQYLSNVIAAVLSHQFKDEMDYSMLSKREEDVVKLLKEGRTNQSIAIELHITMNTVKKHLQHIYQKHSVQNRTQLLHKLQCKRI